MVDEGASPGSEGESRDVPFLGEVRAEYDDTASGHDAKTAHGQSADFLRRSEVAFHQGRRQLYNSNVVEAEACIVTRQERRDIDIESQEIANGVAILGAIQAS